MAMALGFYAVRPVASLMGKKYCTTLSIDYESYLQTPEYQKLMNLLSSTVLCTVTLIFWGISYLTYDPYRMPLQTYCLLSMPLLYLYSGKRGYDSKAFRIFTYAYFPVHLGILILIFFVSFGHL